ncbi:MAG: alkaline phosphatase family protein [Peptococcaceae bacterium]|nr:alkaline phosphatase family protein [Peptococcaceae bacterium]
MSDRKAHAQKLMVLGVDGLDPRFSRRMIDKGMMPNLAKIVERGACREDLVLLGGHPTITPPMWTTLATGCYANVHGITGFYRQHPEDLSAVTYALDSRDCKAEQVWNCTAEAGKKTLVFHWPGSSWPPTSDSENLYVIDGTSPGSLGMATSQTEKEFVLGANEKVKEPKFLNNVDPNVIALCVVEELPERSKQEEEWNLGESAGAIDKMSICTDFDGMGTKSPKIDMVQSYVRPATGWAMELPEDAKETVLLFSQGLLRRPALILKDENGICNKLAIYKSKKATEPIAVLELGVVQGNIYDEGYKGDEKYDVTRTMKLLQMAEDGSSFRMWISAAMNVNVYDTWHPKYMYDYVKEVAGPTPPTANIFEQTEELHQCMIAGWQFTIDWQIKALHEIIKREGIEVVFSHMHNVDLINHTFIHNLSKFSANIMKQYGMSEVEHADYVRWQEELYVMTDNYLGAFLHYLDEGWTIIVTSDHAQVAAEEGMYKFLGQITGYTVTLFEEWGYTTMMRDENGERMREVDWSKTKAITNRSADVWINLKGRNRHVQSNGTVVEGIVDPADKYELEEEIITKLYELKHPRTGKRIVSLAVHNKDAVHFGLGGPECGDIVYFLHESFNQHHGDSLSTAYGAEDTSVSPIFVGAGPGFKSGVYTDRIIRQIDVAPTISALLGVRMPAQCEGAPAYQILDWEY